MAHKLDNLQTQRLAAGLTITGLAKKANVSDQTVKVLENGGWVDVYASKRIADALAVSLATLGQKDI